VSASRVYPERPFLAASVAVMRGDAVLLIRRARPPLDGLFSLPGGMVEPGETLAEAARRELREEVGVEAEIGAVLDLVQVIERDPDDRIRRHFVVAAHAADGSPGKPRPATRPWSLSGSAREKPTISRRPRACCPSSTSPSRQWGRGQKPFAV
jgi:ADP-ribose pyrophosphatase YjhB (NUDIX family)